MEKLHNLRGIRILNSGALLLQFVRKKVIAKEIRKFEKGISLRLRKKKCIKEFLEKYRREGVRT